MRLILTPFHLRPLSAGTRRARLMTKVAARRPIPSTPLPAARSHSPPRRPAASPPHAPRRPRAQPPSHSFDCTVRRMGRGGRWTRIHYAESIVTALSSSSGLKNSQNSSGDAEWSMKSAGGESSCSRSGLLEMLSRADEVSE
jgi:hypothetical protein